MKSIKDIGQEKIGVFLSGGLTCTVFAKFLLEHNCNLHLFWANVSQADEPELDEVFHNFEKHNVPITKVDLRADVGAMALEMIKYNAVYEGNYWNSTGALRYILNKGLAPYFEKENCSFFSHGCVGGGNDQKRFHRYGAFFMQHIKEFTPWDTEELATRFSFRADMYNFLMDNFSFSKSIAYKINRSTDSCLIGTSYEGIDIESLENDYTLIRTLMSKKPWEAEDATTTLHLSFENGRLFKVNNEELSAFELLQKCNHIAGENGISLKSVFENRISDTKCRGVYESPGMDVIAFGFQNLLQICFDKEKSAQYSSLASLIGKSVYRGTFDTVETVANRKEIDELMENLNGEVFLKLYKGNIFCTNVIDKSPEKHLVHQKRFSDGGLVWHNK